MSDSVRPHRRQPTRLLCPWDSPGKNTGVGCHCLLQCMKVKSESEAAQSCLLLATPWTAAHQGPLSMGFSRQEHWSGVPLPSPMRESEKGKWSRSVVSDSLQPHGLQPTRLLRPWEDWSEVATKHGMAEATRRWNRQRMQQRMHALPEPAELAPRCQTPPKLWEQTFVCFSTQFVVICYSSLKKLVHIPSIIFCCVYSYFHLLLFLGFFC